MRQKLPPGLCVLNWLTYFLKHCTLETPLLYGTCQQLPQQQWCLGYVQSAIEHTNNLLPFIEEKLVFTQSR